MASRGVGEVADPASDVIVDDEGEIRLRGAEFFGDLADEDRVRGEGDLVGGVEGSGFNAGSVVQVNGSPISSTLVSPTTLTAVIPATYFTQVGSLSLTVVNAAVSSTSGVIQATPVRLPCSVVPICLALRRP